MGVWGRQPPEASDISKNQIKWKPDIYFFYFLAVLPKSPKVCAGSPAPLKSLAVLHSSLKINSPSPQIPKTPGGPRCSPATLSCDNSYSYCSHSAHSVLICFKIALKCSVKLHPKLATFYICTSVFRCYLYFENYES